MCDFFEVVKIEEIALRLGISIEKAREMAKKKKFGPEVLGGFSADQILAQEKDKDFPKFMVQTR